MQACGIGFAARVELLGPEVWTIGSMGKQGGYILREGILHWCSRQTRYGQNKGIGLSATTL